jgi:hypothetical protein
MRVLLSRFASRLLSMLGVVLKMGARLGFNIKYLFSLPGLNLNI